MLHLADHPAFAERACAVLLTEDISRVLSCTEYDLQTVLHACKLKGDTR